VTSIRLQVEVGSGDARERDLAARQLRRDLDQVDLDGVALVAADEDAARGAGAADAELLVEFDDSAVLVALVQFLSAWAGRGDGKRRVILRDGERSIEVEGASPEQVQLLVAAYVASAQQQPAPRLMAQGSHFQGGDWPDARPGPVPVPGPDSADEPPPLWQTVRRLWRGARR
jgi:hypothetical protein